MIFLDTETSGFEENKIIELAYINSGNSEERFEERFGLKDTKIEIEAMSIHHITEKMIAGKASFEESNHFENIKNLLLNEIIICHNTKFDYGDVLKGVYCLEVPKRICTLKLARRLLPNLPRYNLQYLRYYFGLEFNETIDPHAALSDVIVLKAVYEKLFSIAKVNYNDKSEEEIIEAFIKLESMPVLLGTIEFGKHKGTKWKDCPKDYLEWVVKSGNFDEDVVFTAKTYLS